MADVELTLSVEERQALRALAKLTKNADKFGDEADKSFKKANRAFEVFQGTLAAGIVIDAFKSLARVAVSSIDSIVDKSIELEQIRTQFEVLTRSVENADRLLNDLQTFAATTPFQLPGIANATSQLLAFGFEQDEVIDKLQQLGDVAAGSGSALGEVALIFGQVAAAGKLTGERLLQFQERAIPIGPAIAKTMGVAESAVKDLVSAGKVDFETFEKAFASLSEEGGLFFEGMVKQSKTLGGVLSTLGDNFDLLQTDIGQAFLPTVKELTISLIQLIQNNRDLIKSFATDAAKQFTVALEGTVNTGRDIIVLYKDIENAGDFLFDSFLATQQSLLGLELKFKQTGIALQEFFGLDVAAEATANRIKAIKAETAALEEQRLIIQNETRLREQEQLKIQEAAKKTTEVIAEARSADVQNLQQTQEQKRLLEEQEKARKEEERLQLEAKRLEESEKEFQRLQERNELLREVDEERFAGEIARNEARQKKLVAQESQTSDFVLKVKRDQIRKEQELDKQRLNATAGFFGNLSSIAAFGGKQNFEIAKQAATAEALVQGFLAVQRALGAAPPPFNFALAASVGLKTAANVRQIQAQQLQTGIDSVPGTGTADNFPALLAPGERVVPTKTNQDLTEFLASSGQTNELLVAIRDRLDNINPVAMVQIGNQEVLTSVNDAIDEGGRLAV